MASTVARSYAPRSDLRRTRVRSVGAKASLLMASMVPAGPGRAVAPALLALAARAALAPQEPFDLGGELVAGRQALLLSRHPLEPGDVGARVVVRRDRRVEPLALAERVLGQ